MYGALVAAGQASRNSCAAALGTIAVETASTFAPVREAFWLDEDWRRRNLRYYPYYGRGYIQLTWDYNYRSAGAALGVDLVAAPDRAMEPDIAARVYAWYWTGHAIAAMADRSDWAATRRAVQGGSDGLDRLRAICGALLA